MNTSAVIPRLDLVDGRPVTTSLNIAEVFSKKHPSVMRSIRNLDVPEEFSLCNFAQSTYVNDRGQCQPMYQITRDGFTLLAMGFTGKAAMQFKLAYIEAFNQMEQELMERCSGGDRRRIDVHHSHLRGPVSPQSGLDIRYTLDLTKIILRPSKTTLTLLQRLTGVDVEDLIEEAAHLRPGREREDAVQAFLAAHTETITDYRIPLTEFYAAYRRWCQERQLTASQIGDSRALAATLRQLGFTLEKRSGMILVIGLALRQEVAA